MNDVYDPISIQAKNQISLNNKATTEIFRAQM